jgi:hypothetical protein
MDKVNKMEAFVVAYKMVCGGMETRAVLLICSSYASLLRSLYNVVHDFGYQEGK